VRWPGHGAGGAIRLLHVPRLIIQPPADARRSTRKEVVELRRQALSIPLLRGSWHAAST
jgi:hypothetical protein